MQQSHVSRGSVAAVASGKSMSMYDSQSLFSILLFHHLPFVIWTDNLSDISITLPRQDHDVEVVGKLCERATFYFLFKYSVIHVEYTF
jgi:hypothetical protein